MSFTGDIGGITRQVRLVEDIYHGGTDSQVCRMAAPGYSGILQLECFGGVIYTNSSDCTPDGCVVNQTLDFELGHTTVTQTLAEKMAHDDFYEIPCFNESSSYDGTITINCRLGNLSADISLCGEACYPNITRTFLPVGYETHVVSPESPRLAHGISEQQSCGQFGSAYSGAFVIDCIQGSLNVSETTCVKACEAGMEVLLKLDDGAPVLLNFSRVEHGDSSSALPCVALSKYREGQVTVDCDMGILTANYEDCTFLPCPADATVEVELEGMRTTFGTPTGNELTHGTTWLRPCDAVSYRYVGGISLSCYGGELRANASSCARVDGCFPQDPGVNVSVNGIHMMSANVRPPSHLTAGSVFHVDCESVNPGFEGLIFVECGQDEALTADTSGCDAAPCPRVMAEPVVVEHLSGEVYPSQLLKHGTTEFLPCESVHEGLRGTLSLTCMEGNLLANSSACYVWACVAGSLTTTAPLGGLMSQAQAPIDILDNSGFWMPCFSLRAGFGGNARLNCNGGRLTLDVKRCMQLPCEEVPVADCSANCPAATCRFATA